MENERFYKRGDIYLANLNPHKGSEQGGTRPVLVVQNNQGNFHAQTLIIAPMTAQPEKKKLPTHCYIGKVPGLGESNTVLLEQLRTIDKRRIVSYIGKLSKNQMREAEIGMLISLDLLSAQIQEMRQEAIRRLKHKEADV